MIPIPIVAGRRFSDADSADGRQVAIINPTMVAIAGGSPLGTSIQLSWDSEPRTIVGVAADVKYNSLTEDAIPFIYAPLAQQHWPAVIILIRASTSNPIIALPQLRSALAALDPYIPLENPRLLAWIPARRAGNVRPWAALGDE